MDTLLKPFTLSLLLRSLFAGVLFLLSCYFAVHAPTFDLIEQKPVDFGTFLLASLFIGVVVYSLHRSLVYPIFEAILDSRWCTNLRYKERKIRSVKFRFTFILSSTEKRLVDRWRRPGQPDEVATRLNSWADYVHFQYTASWCVLLGLLTARLLTFGPLRTGTQIVVCVVLLAAALVSDVRIRSVEAFIEKNCPHKPSLS